MRSKRIGIAKAQESAKDADLLLLLSDGVLPYPSVSGYKTSATRPQQD